MKDWEWLEETDKFFHCEPQTSEVFERACKLIACIKEMRWFLESYTDEKYKPMLFFEFEELARETFTRCAEGKFE